MGTNITGKNSRGDTYAQKPAATSAPPSSLAVSASVYVADYIPELNTVNRTDPSGGAINVSLPTIPGGAPIGTIVVVSNVSVSNNDINIVPDVGQTIDLLPSPFLMREGTGSLYLISDGTQNWISLASYAILVGFSTNTQRNTSVGVAAFLVTSDSSVTDTTAVGANALAGCTGNSNTAMGAGAGAAGITGVGNTLVGKAAGGAITGANNTLVGLAAGGSILGAGDNNTNIGSGVSSGFGVSGGTAIGVSAAGSTAFASFNDGVFFHDSVDTMHIAGAAVQYDAASGQIGPVPSARRFKDGIADYTLDASLIYRLRPVTYHLKTSPEFEEFGLIAEEVEEVFPSIVPRDKEGQALSVNYDRLVVPMLAEMKRMRAEIDELRAIVNSK